MNMSVEKNNKVLFACRYLITRGHHQESGLRVSPTTPSPHPPAERLIHVETEGQIRECIHTVCCVQTNSKVSNITTSICMRRSHNWMLITTTTKKKQNSLDVDTFSYLNISFGGYLRPLFLWHGPPISRVYSHYALSTMYFTKKNFTGYIFF